jgi:hypothetical protein
MQIFIKLAGKKTILLHPKSHTPIKYIKDIIERNQQIPQVLFHLKFEGKELDDNNTLEHYNIQNESTLHLKVLHIFFDTGLDKSSRDILIYQKNEAYNYLVMKPELNRYIDILCKNISDKNYNYSYSDYFTSY